MTFDTLRQAPEDFVIAGEQPPVQEREPVERSSLATDTCLQAINPSHREALDRLGACVAEAVGVSAITYAPLRFGAEKRPRQAQHRGAGTLCPAPPQALPADTVLAAGTGASGRSFEAPA